MLKGKSMGAENYIITPFDPDELLMAIRSAFERAQANC